MVFSYGLKLWSINDNYIPDAVRLFRNGACQYIELFIVPDSYDRWIDQWKRFLDEEGVHFIIHAAHFRGGMNLAKKENEAKNMVLIKEAQQFAGHLNADKIIVHPGIVGEISETARQLKKINDKRILVENKPYRALDDGLLCNGSTPEEISFVMREAGVGFCMDIGHAICAANGHGVEPEAFLSKFVSLVPCIYHISDGDKNSVYDSHKHIGEGNFDLRLLLSMIPPGSMITIETEKDTKDNLNDYRNDVSLLRGIHAKQKQK